MTARGGDKTIEIEDAGAVGLVKKTLERLVIKRKTILRILDKEIEQDLEKYEHGEKTKANLDSCKRLLVTTSKYEKDLHLVNEDIETNVETNELENELFEQYRVKSKIDSIKIRLETLMQTLEIKEVKDINNEAKSGVKLPKFVLNTFSGNHLEWKSFKESFEAAIHTNKSLSNIEKFTYLRGYLSSTALQAITGFQLTNENYASAWKLLDERYGNPQLITSGHMNNIIKLERVNNANVKDLRELYDKIESNVRALTSVGIRSDRIGPLLIPLILEKLPNVIRLQISRKLGKENWDIEEFLACINTEIIARENYEFLKQKNDGETPLPKYSGSAMLGAISNRKCIFCKNEHYSDRCNIVTDVKKRQEIVRQNRICFKCLKSGHMKKDCRSRVKCYKCKMENSHPTALCNRDERLYNSNPEDEGSRDPNKEGESKVGCFIKSNTSTLLQTANALAFKKNDQFCAVKLLLDSGAQQSFIDEKIAKKLNLKSIEKIKIKVSGFRSEKEEMINCDVYELYLSPLDNNKNKFTVQLVGVPKICVNIKDQDLKSVINRNKLIKELKLADTSFSSNEKQIDILLGADYYWGFVTGETKRFENEDLVAINTAFGWVLSGNTHKESNNSNNMITNVSMMKMTCENVSSLNEEIHRFWDLDEIGISTNETSVYNKFKDSIKFENSRYSVKLPVKEYHDLLPDNYNLALNRLYRLKERLVYDEILLRKYDNIIQEQLQSGIIEEVTTEGLVGNTTYLPHKEVIKNESSTTKVRIVYDASAKLREQPSLNEVLYTGPCLNPELYQLLLIFRTYPIAITADIKQAYLQISVEEEDRDMLRFLWFKNLFNDENSVLCKYRFTRVIIGATCSQFLLNATLEAHTRRYEQEDPNFVKNVLGKFYVDDLSTGVESVSEGVDLCKKAKLRYLEANFDLRKWRTNNEQLRKYLFQFNDENKISIDTSKHGKILGIEWNEYNDCLIFRLNEKFKNASDILPTKRKILSLISTIYDPIGYLQPVTIQLKILFQTMCKYKVDWDEVITEVIPTWKNICESFNSFQDISISRGYFVYNQDDPVERFILHGFSDSSLSAYAACVYLKSITRSGQVYINLVTAKSRLVPLRKSLTIPRLELLGNFILSKLVSNVYKALSKEIVISEIYCWTDSKISLAWIQNVNEEFETFIENRVIEIRKNVKPNLWNYCNTKANPADIITRISSSNNFSDNPLWWKGPDFIKNNNFEEMYKKDQVKINSTNVSLLCNHLLCNNTEYPCEPASTCEPTQNDVNLDNHVHVQESYVNSIIQKKAVLSITKIEKEKENIENIIDINSFSSYKKLLRVTAWVKRFIENIRKKIKSEELNLFSFISTDELYNVKLLWIKANQYSLPKDQYFKDLENTLNLRETNSLLRVTSRLSNAKTLPYNLKEPLLLNRSHRLTYLIIIDAHQRVKHNGLNHTLSEIRKEYWIPRGKSLIKQYLHKCIICKKFNVRPYNYPKQADLPAHRVNESQCFSSIGIDYTGTLYCKDIYDHNYTDANDTCKCYIVIYTCSISRGIVLDLVPDNSADTFIKSFKKFISRRGCPQFVCSDNGSPFIAKSTKEFCSSKNIEWSFNIAEAPWFGGYWERLIGQVKRCLRKTLGKSMLSFYELESIIYELELIVNSRPLSALFDDEIEEVITPNHLLFGHSLNIENKESLVESNFNLSKHTKYVNDLKEHFWRRWRAEYIPALRENQKLYKRTNDVKPSVDDIVIVYDANQPRHKWLLGKIIKLIKGKDDIVRGAKVYLGKTKKNIERPINKLFPLELHVDTNKVDIEPSRPTKTRREASIIADIKRKLNNY